MRFSIKIGGVIGLAMIALVGAFALSNPAVRTEAKVLLGLEAPLQVTPLAVVASTRPATSRPAVVPTRTPAPTTTPQPAAAAPTRAAQATEVVRPSPTSLPPTPTPGPVEVNGRVYDAYIPAAVKNGQQYQYTCEFDAAWVILQTFGINSSVEEIIERTPMDNPVEPYFEETSSGFIIHGGDIRSAYAGDYTKNFLARSTGGAFVPVFESYGLAVAPVSDRADIEAALRRGALVWMKTTVDFKPWRPATWVTPDGGRIKTVLGNDHAVVVIGFNNEVVVIRDVLGPTSTNRRRQLEYEVDWATFMKSWGAQSFDGLAVEPPTSCNGECRS